MRKLLFCVSLLSLNATFAEAGRTPISEEYETAIVGGGLAGLNTAYGLKQGGKEDVIVFEAQNRLGGRVNTFYDEKEYRELGGEDIDQSKRDQPIRDLCDKLGVKFFVYPRPKAIHCFHGEEPLRYPDLLKIIKAASKIINLSKGKGTVFTSLQDGLNHLFPEDEKTQGVLLALIQGDYGIDPENMDPSCIDWIDQKIKETIPYIKALSAGVLTNAIAEEEGVFRIQGGNSTLVANLAQKIGSPNIKTQHALTKVKKTADGSYTLVFNNSEGEKHKVAARNVVLAIPFSVLRGVKLSLELPEPTQKAIQELPYATYAKVTLPTNPFWGDFKTESFLSLDGKKRFEISDYSFNQDNPGVTVYFAGTQGKENFTDAHTIKPDVLEGLIADLRSKFDRFEVDETRPIISYAPFYDLYAKGSWSTTYNTTTLNYDSNQNGLRLYAQPVGNLYFAGEHTVDFSGHMTSAVLSGDIVSHLILEKDPDDKL